MSMPLKAVVPLCLAACAANEAQAAFDRNGNGLSDVFEFVYFGGPVLPEADPDGDGFSNREEMLWGTDPTNALSVPTGVTATLNGPDLLLSWSVVAGKQYLLHTSLDLRQWETVADGGAGRHLERLDAASGAPEARFWRIQVMADSPDADGNGFDAWEEGLWITFQGTGLEVSDRDQDGLSDAAELRSDRDPAKKDHPAVGLIVFTPLDK